MKKIIFLLIIFINVFITKVNAYSIDNLLYNQEFINILSIELYKKYPSFLINELLNNSWDFTLLDNELLASSYSNILNEDIEIYIDCKSLINFNLDCIVNDEYQNKNEYQLKKNKKTVALTFDDGPSKYTNDIIDLLNDNKANATFFVLGRNISKEFNKITKIIDSNNELGSHTYNHKIITRVRKKDLDYEINNTSYIVKKWFNYDIKLLRPPYGIINNSIKNNYNYSYILWNLDTLDWKSRSAEKVYNKVLDNINDGDIILMHENYFSTYKALEKLLPELYLEGYQVTTVSNLAKLKGYDLEFNKKYSSFK